MKHKKAQLAKALGISTQLMHYYVEKFDREELMPRSLSYSTEDAVKFLLLLAVYFTARGKDRAAERARCAAAKLSEQLTTVES